MYIHEQSINLMIVLGQIEQESESQAEISQNKYALSGNDGVGA